MGVEQEVRFSNFGNVLIADWYRDTTERGVTELSRQIDQLHRQTASPIGLLHIVGADSDPPSTETRKAMAREFKKKDEVIAINATVIDGAGFRAAAVRAVASGIAMLARMKFPHEVHPNLEAGVSRIVRHLGMTPTAKAQLIEAVEELRRRTAA